MQKIKKYYKELVVFAIFLCLILGASISILARNSSTNTPPKPNTQNTLQPSPPTSLAEMGAVLDSRYALLLPHSLQKYIIDNLASHPNAINAIAQTLDSEEWNFLRIINEHRQSIGKGTLRPSIKLTAAAEWMSQDTADRGFLPGDHKDSLGRTAQQRLLDFGYSHSGGENIARTGPTAQNAFNAWMQSPGHKANMEYSGFAAIGIARIQVTTNSYVWTTDFGAVVDQEISQNAPTPTPTATLTPLPSHTPTPTPTIVSQATPTSSPTGTPSGPVDCGVEIMPTTESSYSRLQCMIDRANTCAPAKMNLDLTFDLSPIVDALFNSKMQYDFYKNTQNKCTLHLVVGEQDILRFPPNLTPEEQAQARASMKAMENKEGVCVFPDNSYITNFFTKIKNGDFSFSTDLDSELNMFRGGQCSGEYFEPYFEPTVTSNPTPSPTITNGTTSIKFSFKLPGVGNGTGDNNSPKTLIRTASISLYNQSNQAVGNTKNFQAFYKSSTGVYEGVLDLGSNFESGRYLAKIKISNSLAKNIPGILIITKGSSDHIAPTVTLTTGDIDQDNSLTVKDYNLVLACFRETSPCTTNIKALADINDDGEVASNPDDFAIIQRGFAIREGD